MSEVGAKDLGNKPTVRVLRHMARSGGTLISKCLGSMDPVVLISEIHPGNITDTDPVRQATKWFGLTTPFERFVWKHVRFPGVPEFVDRCVKRAQSRGQTLVLRDWSHLDYIGVPFVEPEFGSALCDCLRDRFRVVETATVRHPIDQWVSLTNLPIAQGLSLDDYLKGCAAFARYAAKTGFVRYEDFTSDPDAQLRVLCERLEIGFDPSYAERWPSYTTVTGDTVRGLGRGVGSGSIRPLTFRDVEPELRRAFAANRDCQEYCELLGYEVDPCSSVRGTSPREIASLSVAPE